MCETLLLPMAKFQVSSKEGRARTGKLITAHGEVATPVFLPVGTQATVKALTPDQLKEMGCEMILSNTYHLYLRPGAETVQELGGLHKFMNWDRPILTDSGGFQVFSLGFGIEHEVGKIFSAGQQDLVMGETLDSSRTEISVRTKLCKIEEDGPTFQSHIDGSAHFFSPEVSVQTQLKLGADFIVALDECTSPLHDYDYTKTSMGRSHRWEERSLLELKKLKSQTDAQMFGVVQGGPFEDLRIQSAKFVSDNDFFGVGIGGALISREKMLEILDWIYPHLDSGKPRHLLGIGTVPDIFLAVERGVDIFDCVVPTRIARMGHIMHKREGTNGQALDKQVAQSFNPERFAYDITKAVFKNDGAPLALDCRCYTCQHYSRAYVHYLFKSHELLAFELATVHNVQFMMDLMREIRQAIMEKRFTKLKQEWLENNK